MLTWSTHDSSSWVGRPRVVAWPSHCGRVVEWSSSWPTHWVNRSSQYTCPLGSRAGRAEGSECWALVGGVMMGEVAGGSAWTGDVTCIYERFFGAKWRGLLDQVDPTVEIFVTFGLPRCLRAINRGCEHWLLTLPDTHWAPILERLWSICVALFVRLRLIMYSHSRPTSSSSVAQSPLPKPPSCSSSLSTSSSNKILSVGAIQTIVPEMEEVRGDDAGNASDRSSSSEWPHPHKGPDWVDPKAFGIASVFHTDASIAKILNRVPVLKAGIPYCRSVLARWTTVYTRNGHLPNPPSSSCTIAFFLTHTCRFLSTRSRWVSFRHSTWRRVNCTQTHGRPCRLFAWCAERSVCILMQIVSSISTPLTRPTWLAGTLWSVGRAVSCSKPSGHPTRTLKKDFLRCWWNRRAHPTCSTRLVSQGFLCFGQGIQPR